MSAQTFDTIGQTLTEEVANNKYSSTSYHTLKLNAKLNSIKEDVLKANVTLDCVLISKWLSWADDTIIFSVGVDGKEKANASAKSGGGTTTKTYVTWNGDIPYNEDGTLTATLYAKSSDKNGVYSPPNQTAEIIATFPTIEVSDAHVGFNGKVEKSRLYIGNNEGDFYIGINGVPTKCS